MSAVRARFEAQPNPNPRSPMGQRNPGVDTHITRPQRYDAHVEKLRASVTQSPGALSPEVRAAIVTRDTPNIPPALAPFVIKVALHAYKVTDEDVAQLRREGFSEDQIFEATAAAAVGAALLRLDKGMAALRGA